MDGVGIRLFQIHLCFRLSLSSRSVVLPLYGLRCQLCRHSVEDKSSDCILSSRFRTDLILKQSEFGKSLLPALQNEISRNCLCCKRPHNPTPAQRAIQRAKQRRTQMATQIALESRLSVSLSWCETLWLIQVLAKVGRGYNTKIKGDNREGLYRCTMLPVPHPGEKIKWSI